MVANTSNQVFFIYSSRWIDQNKYLFTGVIDLVKHGTIYTPVCS